MASEILLVISEVMLSKPRIPSLGKEKRKEFVPQRNVFMWLDPALIRPGRVDVREFVGPASDHQLAALFRRFYPQEGEADAGAFVQAVRREFGETPLSMALVQGYFLFHKDDPRSAIRDVAQMAKL
ncbi:hypothetical protein HPB50_012135 [Hyalomma asiaticum]|uniref:Uncharacterized protein n=1 Tax=Hyalomma asiaticum TaxID=266040 RepID=A0ACB7S8Y6_HYAAI|nr:hypothetical protein HPB50_012135 [Hyalomma asiaticum]